jgi:hypothetical protein
MGQSARAGKVSGISLTEMSHLSARQSAGHLSHDADEQVMALAQDTT